MTVEIVEVEGWEADLMMFIIWRKTYMHIWNHIEHRMITEARHQLAMIERACV